MTKAQSIRRPAFKTVIACATTTGAALAAMALLANAVRADDSAFTSGTTLSVASGAEVYSHICQGCHMSEGQGAVGAGHYPKLAGDPALVSWEYVALTILNGRNGMPPFGLPPDEVAALRTVHLSDAQVADVVNYVRSHFGNKYKNTVTAAQITRLAHPTDPPPVE